MTPNNIYTAFMYSQFAVAVVKSVSWSCCRQRWWSDLKRRR